MNELLDLNWDVFVTPGIPAVTSDPPPGTEQQMWSPISSTLIYGQRDAVLVDAFITVEQAKALGFNEVIDTSVEKLGDGVRRITGGYGTDIIIDGVGGEVLGEALGALALGGSLTTLGYAASRKATIDVTNLIWKRASIKSFILFAQPQADAWNAAMFLCAERVAAWRNRSRNWVNPPARSADYG